MKKLLVCLSTLLPFARVFAQETISPLAFTLSAKVEDASSGFMTLNYLDSKNAEVTDTAYLKNNTFFFSGNIAHHHRASLKGYFEQGAKSDNNKMQIFLEAGKIEVKLKKNDFDQAIVKGTKLNDQWQAHQIIKQENNRQREEAHQLLLSLNAQKKEKPSDQLTFQIDSLNKNMEALRLASRKLDYAYIQQNPNAEYSAYLMDYYFSSRMLTLDSAQLFIGQFSNDVKQSYYGTYMTQQVAARIASSVGQIAPPFSRTDIEGKAINLEQFRHKNYVLLDFWASWCVPCREENPRLKQLYATYSKEGLEIISIAWEFKAEPGPWKQAITKDGTGAWRHVMASLSAPDDGNLWNRYSIASIPTLILIDKQGKIIGRYRGASDEGSMDDLEKKLNETLKP
jgi:thiol-disulfide isomerase/thioredoxin